MRVRRLLPLLPALVGMTLFVISVSSLLQALRHHRPDQIWQRFAGDSGAVSAGGGGFNGAE